MNNDEETGMPASLKKLLIACIGGVVMLFVAGMLAGYTAKALEYDELILRDYGYIGGLSALLILIAFVCWKLWPERSDEIVAESTRKSTLLLQLSCGVGALIAVALLFTEGAEDFPLFSTGPISPGFALFAIAVWFVLVPPLTWKWWRTVDEHEASAYSDGALVAGHAYIFIAPAWWMATRAGWLPAQDPMIVFLIVCFIWTAVWFYRRYA